MSEPIHEPVSEPIRDPDNPYNLPPMNEHKKQLLEQLFKQQEVFDNLVREKGRDNLFVFNRFVLGVEEGKQELGVFHKKLCNFVTDDMHKKKLILMPRGHLKSTLITIGYSVFRIVRDPNVRILLLNATWQMAVDFLTEIKRHLTANERLIELFGPLAEGNEEWSQDRITLKRKNHNIKGPTVWAAGVETNLVGSHPDLIIMDDVVSRDNVETQESRDKVILRYKDVLDLLEPGGQLIVIGTRWAEGELYSWLMDKDTGIAESYDIMIKKAYEGNLTTGEGFVPLWPEKFTREELITRLREKGWYEFSAQYMNNPVPDENATFKRRWFQPYDPEDIRGKDLTKVITIDPAIALTKEADYTAMVVTGIDIFGNIFILDMVRAKMTPNQIVAKIFELNGIWRPNTIGIETIAYQKALAYTIKDEMVSRRRSLPIVEVRPEERSKDQRIKGLQPSYENLKVFHPKNHPLTRYLEDELATYPRGRHDDLIDALSYALDLLFPPRKKTSRYHQTYLY